MTTHDPEETAVLAVLSSEVEAEILAAALRDLGIDAQASGVLTASFRAEAPGGAKVLVHRGDLARAMELVAEIRQANAAIDWSKVDVGERLEEADEDEA